MSCTSMWRARLMNFSTKTSAQPKAFFASDRAVRVSYKIKPGDTLAAIASQYGTTVQTLQQWNGLRSSRITAGGRLTIYTR